VGVATAGDPRADALSAYGPAALVVVVGARWPKSWSGRWRGRPRQPRTGGILSISGSSWVPSWRLPPVNATARGMPAPSVRTWCFEPGRARSNGLEPLLRPRLAPAHARADHRAGPVSLPAVLEFSHQQLVQPLPHPGPVPSLQAPPAGHPGPEPQLLGQELPLDARVQPEQDAAQHLPVRDPLVTDPAARLGPAETPPTVIIRSSNNARHRWASVYPASGSHRCIMASSHNCPCSMLAALVPPPDRTAAQPTSTSRLEY